MIEIYFGIKEVKRTSLADELVNRMRKGIATFTYRKADGSIRKAIGTRRLDLARRIGDEMRTPSGAPRPYCYFDLERHDWRSFRPERVISIEG